MVFTRLLDVGMSILVSWLGGDVLDAVFPDAIPSLTSVAMEHADMPPIIIGDVVGRHLATIEELSPQELEDVSNTPVPRIDAMHVRNSHNMCVLEYGSAAPCDFERMYLEKQLEIWKWNP